MIPNPIAPTRPSLGMAAFGGLLLVSILAGCQPAGTPSSMQAPPPPAVTVAPVEQRELTEWNEFTGRTAPVDYVEIRPRVSGHIDEVRFTSGQLVKKGDVLFVIDARWYKAELDRREAEHAMAHVRVDNAEREAKRTAQLLASRAISQEEADAREARYQEARAALVAAEAAINSARLDYEHTSIRSPIDGRVSRAWVTPGNYVSPVPGNNGILTTVVSIDPIHVYVDMDENTLLQFNALRRDGQIGGTSGKIDVELQLANEAGFEHRGYVESLDNRVDPQTGSIVLRAVVPNPDGRIVPGLFARLRVPSSARHPALLIDETAIGTDQAQKFVLALSASNTAAYRPVELGPLVAGKRIVRKGLGAGERVIVNGVARVRPGMPVSPQDPGAEPKANAGAAH